MAYWFFSGTTEEDKEVISYYVTNPAGKYEEFNSASVGRPQCMERRSMQCTRTIRLRIRP